MVEEYFGAVVKSRLYVHSEPVATYHEHYSSKFSVSAKAELINLEENFA